MGRDYIKKILLVGSSGKRDNEWGMCCGSGICGNEWGMGGSS